MFCGVRRWCWFRTVIRYTGMDRALSANIVEPDCPYGAIAQLCNRAIARVQTGCAMHPPNCQTLVELLCHQASTHFDRRANARDYPLSPAQRQIWFLTQLQPDSPVYNLPVALQLRGKLDRDRLKGAIEGAIARHEALRTCFHNQGGEPARAIVPELTPEISIVDLQHLTLDRSRQQARELASELARTPFDLEQLPLWRVRIVRVAPSESVLIFVAHHIICDGRSIELLLSELSAVYGSRSLRSVSLQDLDVTDWQNRQFQTAEFAERLENRAQQLRHSPPALELPMARSRPPVQTFRGASYRFELSGELTAALKTLSQQENVTLFMTLLAAFKTLLYRYSGQTDLLVGSPIANRDRPWRNRSNSQPAF